jgi:aspartate dehydrogenase
VKHHRIGVIGYGAIGQVITRMLIDKQYPSISLIAVLVRDIDKYSNHTKYLTRNRILLTEDLGAFLASKPDLIVEAAGQNAVRQYAEQILQADIDLIICSIGAFTDLSLLSRLRDIAQDRGRYLYLAAGALPGVGWMQGASLSEVRMLKITQIKPVFSWIGTYAENLVDLQSLKAPVTFFKGSSKQSASLFPKSSNITALLGLATIGMENLSVELVADPTISRMRTEIHFVGEAGELTITWQGEPTDINPSTSKDVALNVVKALKNLCSSVQIGV